MYLDIVDLRIFYGERLGQAARRLIAERMRKRWPSVAGESVLGLGFATPYLADFVAEAERVVAFMPAAQGVARWPPDGPNVAALVEEDSLPLTDSSIDRVIVIHSLEMSARPHDVLREIWRVLAPGGRLLLVVPNRRGIWARVETTPFGVGRPYGRGQLTALLRDALFLPVGWSEALAVPPIRQRALLRSGRAWEKVGSILWPGFAGVIIVEATKQLYQGIPSRQPSRSPAGLKPAMRPALVPPATTRTCRDSHETAAPLS